VNQRFPSGPNTMPCSPLLAVGTGNSVINDMFGVAGGLWLGLATPILLGDAGPTADVGTRPQHDKIVTAIEATAATALRRRDVVMATTRAESALALLTVQT
jgi:hypothetical protein